MFARALPSSEPFLKAVRALIFIDGRDRRTGYSLGGSLRPGKITPALLVALPILFAAALDTQVSLAERLGNCQCTDYVYSRRADLPQSMGVAKNWLPSARPVRRPYDQGPQSGDGGVVLQGGCGFY